MTVERNPITGVCVTCVLVVLVA